MAQQDNAIAIIPCEGVQSQECTDHASVQSHLHSELDQALNTTLPQPPRQRTSSKLTYSIAADVPSTARLEYEFHAGLFYVNAAPAAPRCLVSSACGRDWMSESALYSIRRGLQARRLHLKINYYATIDHRLRSKLPTQQASRKSAEEPHLGAPS